MHISCVYATLHVHYDMFCMFYFVLIFSSYKALLEKLAVLEKEKRQLKDRANSLEAQLALKGRAVKEVEGMIEQVEEKHKEVSVIKGLLSLLYKFNVHLVFLKSHVYLVHRLHSFRVYILYTA